MQVKKFEAPTLQEALETIKRELGPEAIILQTKQNRRGFGLMSKGSVEVTAAVSERSIEKKKGVERKLTDAYTQKVQTLGAGQQADLYDKYLEKSVKKDNVQLSGNQGKSSYSETSAKRRTAVRYADIQDDDSVIETNPPFTLPEITTKPEPVSIPQYQTPSHVGSAIDHYSQNQNESFSLIQEELAQLKRVVEELKREKNRPEYLDSDSPFAATEALQEGYEIILESGIDRRLAVQVMREAIKELSIEARADHDAVMDALAGNIMSRVQTQSFFGEAIAENNRPQITAFVGASGVGKTTLIAKLATHASRKRNEKIGIIRILNPQDDGVDPLVVFAKALHVPYRSVRSIEEFAVAIQDMSQAHRVFIDTSSISSRDPVGIRQLEVILKSQKKVNTQVVISSTTRTLEQREQISALKTLNPQGMMVTRLDESYSFGSIYSISNRSKLPLTIFSKGRSVTEDWENATSERLTASILNIQ